MSVIGDYAWVGAGRWLVIKEGWVVDLVVYVPSVGVQHLIDGLLLLCWRLGMYLTVERPARNGERRRTGGSVRVKAAGLSRFHALHLAAALALVFVLALTRVRTISLTWNLILNGARATSASEHM